MAVDSKRLGRKIRQLRERAGYKNQVDFGAALDVSWPTVSRIERGVTLPSLDRLFRIATLLDTTPQELLDEEDAA